MKEITVIEPCNFVDFPTGGQLTFVRNLLHSFNGELNLVGISTGKEEIGSWTIKEIDGKKYRFFPFMKGIRRKNKPLIPMRLQAYNSLRKYRSTIAEGCSEIIVIQAPEVLLALNSKIQDRKICFIFPGIKNPLNYSRYFYAKIFASAYDSLFLSQVASAHWILAAADSLAIKELEIRGKGFNGKSVIQFPTRIDENIFKKVNNNNYKETLKIAKSTKVIVTCGRLGYYKGWQLMIDAYKLFHERYPNSVFFVIGDGEDHEKIVRYIELNELENNIFLPGFLKNTEISKYLNIADVFIMGSYTEGWSTTLLEAACIGVPSVVTNFSSSYDIIKNGINGYVVENRSVIDFSEMMIKALQIDRRALPEKRMEQFTLKTLKSDLVKIIQ
ncbi:Glycosyltransferase involved in cell wall bisynthesis [Draconibacterium orientale]|uniref:Glycosyltransferase involved in cell wall bisynthesis n=1 Tax=Draconibacterium orientale TaxID=1168034 RepID=X5E485_9BACT|nr:glycosyltransferase [Draconibacterium orientale]AHW62270.1 hypothetical protein FH5T_18640 [Draconibacterium orientale]SET86550.1 Glycosyltransferase involved in cell wall bisynthesis [Draconibacterium orientale]